MPNPIARLRAFWICHGEWVLLGVVFALSLSTGYGFAAREFQATILEVQSRHQEELRNEKAYLRAVIASKNDDIRRLQGTQGDLAKRATETAKASTEAVKAISEGVSTPK